MRGKPVCNHQVLVVEDDADIRDIMLALLTEEGFQVEAAENGFEALNVLKRAESLPCVILLDMMMPVMNGWEFLEAIRNQPDHCELAVVIVSAATIDLKALRPSGYLRSRSTCFSMKSTRTANRPTARLTS